MHGRRLLTTLLMLAFALPTGLSAADMPTSDSSDSSAETTQKHDPSTCPHCAARQRPVVILVGADRDVMKLGQFPDLVGQFRCRGFQAVYFDPLAQFNDASVLAGWLRSYSRCGRRIMVVGWSYGAVVAIKALNIVRREGICIDTFVELDCYFLNRHVGSRNLASNARRTVVLRSQLNDTPKGYRRPCFYRLDTMWHMSVPSEPQTLRILTTEAYRLRTPVHRASQSNTTAQQALRKYVR